MPIVKVTNLSYEFIPATGGAQHQVTAGAAASDFLSFTPASSTKYFNLSVTGGGFYYTIDGSDPEAATPHGNLLPEGSSAVINKIYAETIKIIRSGASDAIINVQEVDVRGGG